MSKKVRLLESWGEICGALANTSGGVVFVLDLDSDDMCMALYMQVSDLLDKCKDDDVIFIEVYQEDE